MDEDQAAKAIAEKFAALEWCSRRRGRLDESPEGRVYVLWGEGTPWFKVGFTTRSVDERAWTIMESLPFRVRIIGERPGTRRMEADIHRILSRYRTNGEWFDLSEPVAWVVIRWAGLEEQVRREEEAKSA